MVLATLSGKHSVDAKKKQSSVKDKMVLQRILVSISTPFVHTEKSRRDYTVLSDMSNRKDRYDERARKKVSLVTEHLAMRLAKVAARDSYHGRS